MRCNFCCKILTFEFLLFSSNFMLCCSCKNASTLILSNKSMLKLSSFENSSLFKNSMSFFRHLFITLWHLNSCFSNWMMRACFLFFASRVACWIFRSCWRLMMTCFDEFVTSVNLFWSCWRVLIRSSLSWFTWSLWNSWSFRIMFWVWRMLIFLRSFWSKNHSISHNVQIDASIYYHCQTW